MPKGDRSGDIAAVVFLAAIVVFSGLAIWDISAKHTLYAVQADQAAAEHAEQAQQQIQETCTFADVARQAECIEQIIVVRREAQRAEYDLQAQRGMADWALYGIVISGFMLLITGTGVWFVKRTLEATHEMVGEARDATKAAQRAADATDRAAADTRDIGQKQIRAYLSCIGGRYEIHPGTIQVEPEFSNKGQSPAFDVELTVQIEVMVYSPQEPSGAEHPRKTETISSGSKDGRCADIPAGSTAHGHSWFFTSDIKMPFSDIIDQAVNRKRPMRVNCAFSWLDVFGDRQTAFAKLAAKAPEGTGLASIFSKEGGLEVMQQSISRNDKDATAPESNTKT